MFVTQGLEVPLIAVLQWSTSKLPFTSSIYTHYSVPGIRLDRPHFIMTASCPSAVRAHEHFRVRYTLLNNLQDFLAVRLVWTPEGEEEGHWGGKLIEFWIKEEVMELWCFSSVGL